MRALSIGLIAFACFAFLTVATTGRRSFRLRHSDPERKPVPSLLLTFQPDGGDPVGRSRTPMENSPSNTTRRRKARWSADTRSPRPTAPRRPRRNGPEKPMSAETKAVTKKLWRRRERHDYRNHESRVESGIEIRLTTIPGGTSIRRGSHRRGNADGHHVRNRTRVTESRRTLAG